MALWMRLRYPTPEDPFDPTDGFSEEAVRLAALGCTYLELAEVMGNSAERHHLHRETLRQRAVHGNQSYMHHWGEYREAYAVYRMQLRDMFPTEADRSPSG